MEDSKKLKSIELIEITLFGSKTTFGGSRVSPTCYSGQEEKSAVADWLMNKIPEVRNPTKHELKMGS